MKNFREWLSDNLRYIILAIVIIAVLVMLFFGVRMLSDKFDNTPSGEVKSTEESTVTETPKKDDEVSPTPLPAPEATADMKKNGNAQVTALINTYYSALAAKNVNTLKTVVDNLDEADQTAVTGSPVEAYNSVDTYTSPGAEEGSYVAYATYSYKLAGYDTQVPSLSQFYVKTDDKGVLHIVTNTDDAVISQAFETANQTADAQALISQTQASYDQAIASDPALAAYLGEVSSQAQATQDNGGQAAEEAQAQQADQTQTTAEATTITIKNSANIRDAASSQSNVIGEVPSGASVTKSGESGGWFLIDYNGVHGWVWGKLVS